MASPAPGRPPRRRRLALALLLGLALAVLSLFIAPVPIPLVEIFRILVHELTLGLGVQPGLPCRGLPDPVPRVDDDHLGQLGPGRSSFRSSSGAALGPLGGDPAGHLPQPPGGPVPVRAFRRAERSGPPCCSSLASTSRRRTSRFRCSPSWAPSPRGGDPRAGTRCLGGRVETLLLVGVALANLLSAILSVVLLFNPGEPAGELLAPRGSRGANWEWDGIVLGGLMMAGAPLFLLGRELNLLQLGPDVAQSLGVDARKVRTRLLLLASAATAVAVAFTGIIGFVGLIAPHVVRRVWGPDYRAVLPGSALVGGAFLLARPRPFWGRGSLGRAPGGAVHGVRRRARSSSTCSTGTATVRSWGPAIDRPLPGPLRRGRHGAVRGAYGSPPGRPGGAPGGAPRPDRAERVREDDADPGRSRPPPTLGGPDPTVRRADRGSVHPGARPTGRVGPSGGGPAGQRAASSTTSSTGGSPTCHRSRARRRRTGPAADRALQDVGLSDRAYSGILELSGGERQRLLLARGLAQEAPLLLLDEPTAHLDIGHQLDLLERVQRLVRDRHVCAVAALHDLNLAGRFADRVVVLSHGRRVADGPPEATLTPGILRSVWGVDAERRRDSRTGATYLVPYRPAAATPPYPPGSRGPVHVDRRRRGRSSAPSRLGRRRLDGLGRGPPVARHRRGGGRGARGSVHRGDPVRADRGRGDRPAHRAARPTSGPSSWPPSRSDRPTSRTSRRSAAGRAALPCSWWSPRRSGAGTSPRGRPRGRASS